MSPIKQVVPIQNGSILSISLFIQGGLLKMGEATFRLAEIKDKTKDSKGFIYLYVDPSEKRFVHPDDVYRSNGLPRVKPVQIQAFANHSHYKFIRFVATIP